MKKAVIAGVVGVFALGMLSCGGGHGGCDAYRKADYTKYKEESILLVFMIRVVVTRVIMWFRCSSKFHAFRLQSFNIFCRIFLKCPTASLAVKIDSFSRMIRK